MKFLVVIAWALVVLLTGCRSTTPVASLGPLSDPIVPYQNFAATIIEPAASVDFCPTDTRLFIRVNGVADWDLGNEQDPMIAEVRRLLGEVAPPTVWERAKAATGLSDEALFRRCFNDQVALIHLPAEDGEKAVAIVTRLTPEFAEALPELCAMRPRAGTRQLGPFSLYTLKEGERELAFALGQRWLVIAEAKHQQQMFRVLSCHRSSVDPASAALSLPKAKLFADLRTQLPTAVRVLVYSRNRVATDHHVLTIVGSGADIRINYAGHVPLTDSSEREQQAPVIPATPELTFGPLPAATVGAASLNLVKPAIPGLDILDWLLFSSDLKHDLLPHIRPPIVVYLGNSLTMKDQPAPAVGLAIHLGNTVAGRELDRLMRTVHMLLTLGRLDVPKLLFGASRRHVGDTSYRVLNFGNALANRIRDPSVSEIAKLPGGRGLTHLSCGLIGDWYVVSSQERFFRDMAKRWQDAGAETEFVDAFAPREGRVLTAIADVPGIAAILDNVSRAWHDTHKQSVLASEASEPVINMPIDRLMTRARLLGDAGETMGLYWRRFHASTYDPVELPKGRSGSNWEGAKAKRERQSHVGRALRWIANALLGRQQFKAELWRAADGNPRGRIHVLGGDTKGQDQDKD